jgi:diguanylate cyclase (GGDEF)-like protein
VKDSNWLIRDGMDRERMLDMDKRIRPARIASLLVIAVALLACGPWLGWWTLAPLVLAGVLFSRADKVMPRMKRPEYAMFAAWAGSEIIIAISVALSGGPKIATMSWLAMPLVTLASRFSNRGIAAGVALALVLLLAVSFIVDPHAVIHDPPFVIAPAALIIAVTLLSIALMQSDVEFRNRAVLDELTGMLNRSALATRVSELTQQSRVTGESVGIIIADIDHFKCINDEHGHARGDAVLTDVAYTLRKCLRAYDLAYRLGGEEFLVLVPGAEQAQVEALAEELRASVAAGPLAGGLSVTISCGVAASLPGQALDYPTLFAAADERLYRAKRAGRNQVCCSDAQLDATPLAA